MNRLSKSALSKARLPGLWLSLSLLVGAVYDILFSLGILTVPARLAGTLGLPMPADELYLRFISVFLLGLAMVYLLPVVDAVRYRPVAWLAVVIRAMGFVFLASSVVWFDRPAVFLLLAAGDGAFALAHLGGLLATRGTGGTP